MDEVNGLAGGAAMDFAGDDECEVEYCIRIRGGTVDNGDFVRLRVVQGSGSEFVFHDNVPNITVFEA
jgi:hypothetical protein